MGDETANKLPVLSLSAEQRLHLVQILPPKSGSFKEMVQIRQLRDSLLFDEEEKEAIEWDESGNGTSFDPTKLGDLDAKDFEFRPKQIELIAYSFVKKKQEEDLATNDTFVDLYLMFEEAIEEVDEE